MKIRNVHLIGSEAGRQALVSMAEGVEGYKVTYTPLPTNTLEPKEADEAFSKELHDLENADLVVIDLDAAPAEAAFSIGYAVARGRSVVGVSLRPKGSLDYRLSVPIFVVKDMIALKHLLTKLAEHG